jgi:hypothetical protein
MGLIIGWFYWVSLGWVRLRFSAIINIYGFYYFPPNVLYTWLNNLFRKEHNYSKFHHAHRKWGKSLF